MNASVEVIEKTRAPLAGEEVLDMPQIAWPEVL